MSPPISATYSGFGSEENLQQVMDERKRKRTVSNRESARRSRMKRQKHLDNLIAQENQLRAENHQIQANINVVTQLYTNVESENSVLWAQMSELYHRLQALHDIISYINSIYRINNVAGFEMDVYDGGVIMPGMV